MVLSAARAAAETHFMKFFFLLLHTSLFDFTKDQLSVHAFLNEKTCRKKDFEGSE